MGKSEKSAKKDKAHKASKKDKVKSSKVEKRKDKTEKHKKEKHKKEKHNKKKKSKEDKPAPAETDQPTAMGWNNWAAAEFESDERKQKFLRFMGIKQGADSAKTGSSASPFASAITKEGASSINSDLEKQFSAGLGQRHQGRRGGLGF